MKHSIYHLLIAVFFSGISLSDKLIAQSWVAAVYPTQNAINASQNTAIEVEFSRDIDPTSVNESIKVFGKQTGFIPGNVLYDANSRRMTFTPYELFKVGEYVTVSITTAIEDNQQNPMPLPFVWNFIIAPTKGYGRFEYFSHVRPGDISHPWNIEAGDFDNDHDIDVVASHYLYVGEISLQRNTGDGHLLNNSVLKYGRYTNRICSADFNNDQTLDLALAQGRPHVTILKNSGSGFFTEMDTTYLNAFPRDFAASDFNGDGYLDLATSNGGAYNAIVLFNDGFGNMNIAQTIEFVFVPNAIATGDFDLDGDMDIAVAITEQNGMEFDGWLVTLLNDGTGQFSYYSQTPVPAIAVETTVADFDNDSDLDIGLIINTEYGAAVVLNDGSGNFQLSQHITGQNHHLSITSGDYDADGDVDIAYTNRAGAPGSLAILKNDGNGHFVKSNIPMDIGTYSIRTADLDNDGSLDLAVAAIFLTDTRIYTMLNTPQTGIESQPDGVPLNYSLSQNYPNPFNAQTIIEYELPEHGNISLELFNMNGEKVRTLFEGAKPAGYHRLELNAEGLASGIYFYRLKAGEFVRAWKLLLVR